MDKKQKLILVTKDLIIQAKGDVEKITIRSIADSANMSVGLVNYHFKSKEHLIELCVQDFIGDFIQDLKKKVEGEDLSNADKLSIVAKHVADFLTENKEMARISILGDYKKPNLEDNSSKACKGFLSLLTGGERAKSFELNQLIFILYSSIQTAFLRNDINIELCGLDFFDKIGRDELIDQIINRLFKEDKNVGIC